MGNAAPWNQVVLAAVTVAVLTAACSARDGDNAGASEASRPASEEALVPDRPTTPRPDEEPPGNEPASETSTQSPPTRHVAEPSAVDLKDLAPTPQTGGAPAEAPAPGLPSALPRLVRDVKLDLGKRLDLDISEIEQVSADEVTWPDTSLGCPEPGAMYAQVMTPGYRIVLRASGKDYAYHTRDASAFVLCEPRQPGRAR